MLEPGRALGIPSWPCVRWQLTPWLSLPRPSPLPPPRPLQVTGLAVSDRHPYMFSCGLDKQVKCWDLEQNKVWREGGREEGGMVVCVLVRVGGWGLDKQVKWWDLGSRGW